MPSASSSGFSPAPRRPWRRFLLFCGLLGACATQTTTPAPAPLDTASVAPSPMPVSPSPSPSPSKLDGRWTWGNLPEPPGGHISTCNRPPISFVQDGERLWMLREDEGCGPANEKLPATLSGDQLIASGRRYQGLGDEDVRYELTYHADTQHWVGTRNGKPLWLAPASNICPSPAKLCSFSLRGRVFDEAGKPVPNQPPLKLRVRSTNPSTPFDSTVDIRNGAYTIAGLPDSRGLEFTLLSGETVRQRRVLTNPDLYLVNFGGPSTPADPDAPHYPLPVRPSPTPTARPLS